MKPLLIPCLAISVAGCASRPSDRTLVAEEVVDGSGATLRAELHYEIQSARVVEFVLDLSVSGFEQTEKLVSSVFIQGLDLQDGALSWNGFVAPRQPQKHRATFETVEGFDTASVTLTLQRSADSFVLLRERVMFTVSEDGRLTAQEAAIDE